MARTETSLEERSKEELINIIKQNNIISKRLCAVVVYLLAQGEDGLHIGKVLAKWNKITRKETPGDWFDYGFEIFPWVTCADGFGFSVQAHQGAYCSPRTSNALIYEEVEIGFPSEEESLFTHNERWEGDILPYCPIEIVHAVINKHGGLWSGKGIPATPKSGEPQ